MGIPNLVGGSAVVLTIDLGGRVVVHAANCVNVAVTIRWACVRHAAEITRKSDGNSCRARPQVVLEPAGLVAVGEATH